SGLYLRGSTLEEDMAKPSVQAFRFPFVAYSNRNRVRYWGRTPTSTPGKVVLLAKQGRKWRRVGTTLANRFGIFQGSTSISRRMHPMRGHMQAVYRGERSVPFSLKRIRNFYQPPFG